MRVKVTIENWRYVKEGTNNDHVINRVGMWWYSGVFCALYM